MKTLLIDLEVLKKNLPKEILKMAGNIEKTCFIEDALLPLC